MNSKSLIIIALCACQMALAQDSLRVETVQDSGFTTPQYVSEFDDVFLSKKETKWLFKVDWLPLLKDKGESNFVGLGLEFERKLGKSFSVNAAVFMDRNFSLGTNWENKYYFHNTAPILPISVGIEPRWFFSPKKSNNLNGQYIGLMLRYSHTLNGYEDSPGIWFPGSGSNIIVNRQHDGMDYALNYGIQKRILNNWYVNYRIGLVYRSRSTFNANSLFISDKLSFENQFTVGTAFGRGKKATYQTCDLFQCFEDENYLLKIDVNKLLSLLTQHAIFSQATIGFETKINHSSWSINTEFKPNYFRWNYGNQIYQRINNPDFKGSYISTLYFGFNVEPRFYYNLQKRMAKGRTANNLSGSYFSVAFNYFHVRKRLNESVAPMSSPRLFKYNYDFWVFAPRYGIQRRVFKHGFLDIAAAPLQLNFNQKRVGEKFYWGNHNLPLFDVKIGFAF